MPLLQKRQGPDWCPDAETLCALAEGNVTQAVKDAFGAHAAGCPACANLYERLRRFDQAGSPLQEPEWCQTEKRLDNWLESSLASGATVHAMGRRVRQSGLRLWWQGLTEQLGALQMRRLLIPTAAFALVICSFLAGRVSVRRVPQLVAEAVPPKDAIANATRPSTAITDIPSARKPTKEVRPSQPAPLARPSPAQPNRIASSAPQVARSRPGSSVPHRPTETAAVAPPATTSFEAAEPTGTSAPPTPLSPADQTNRPIEAARTPGPVTSANPGQSATRAAVRTALPGSGVRTVAALRSDAASIPDAKTHHPPAIPAPAEVRLDAGTRVWISLKSVHERADGVSEFSGVALLPVMQSGAVLLDRSTQIWGIVSVRQGKTTVQIMEFVSNGARYRLKGTGGEANTRAATGTAVKFDAGKVLETWIVSASIFGKLPEEVRPPEK